MKCVQGFNPLLTQSPRLPVCDDLFYVCLSLLYLCITFCISHRRVDSSSNENALKSVLWGISLKDSTNALPTQILIPLLSVLDPNSTQPLE